MLFPLFSQVSVPAFDAPKFEAPKIDVPKFDVPKFDAPKFDAPKMAIPKFDAPQASGGYDFGAPAKSSSSVDDDDVEPQEIRDERARGAASVFRDADKEAKVCTTKLSRSSSRNGWM